MGFKRNYGFFKDDNDKIFDTRTYKRNSYGIFNKKRDISLNKLIIVIFLIMLNFMAYYVIIYLFSNYNYNQQFENSVNLDSNGYNLQISQKVVYNYEPPNELGNIISPRASAELMLLYTNRMENLTEVYSDGNIIFDKNNKFEGQYSTLYGMRNQDRHSYITKCKNVNTSANYLSYDETIDLAFYFKYTSSNGFVNKIPYINLQIEFRNEMNEKINIGFIVLGQARNQSVFSDSELLYPNFWINVSDSSYVSNMWVLANIMDIRSYLVNYTNFEGTIYINKVAVYCGNHGSNNVGLLNMWIDYLTITKKPFVYNGNAIWYDLNGERVYDYQILTSFRLLIIDIYYNITDVVNSPIFINIYNSISINKLSSNLIEVEQLGIVSNLSIYTNLISLQSDYTISISETIVNGTNAHIIQGNYISSSLPLPSNDHYGKFLEFETYGMYNIYAQQIKEEWEYVSLENPLLISTFRIKQQPSLIVL